MVESYSALADGNITSYGCTMPSRPVGRLLDLEYEILDVCASLISDDEEVYGFALARLLADRSASTLIGHGTLYKALSRLVKMGMLEARWGESPDDGRPRRRLYALSGEGERVLRARPIPALVVGVRRPATA